LEFLQPPVDMGKRILVYIIFSPWNLKLSCKYS